MTEQNETESFETVTDETVNGLAAPPADDSEQQSDETQTSETTDSTESGSESETDKQSESADDASAPRDNKGRYKKRIDKLTRQKRELERQLKAEREGKQGGKSTNESSTQEKAEPEADQYDNYDDYLEALANYYGDEDDDKGDNAQQDSKKSETDKGNDAEGESESDPELESAMDEINDSFEDAREKYSDFDEVVLSDEVPVTRDMAIAISNTDEPGDIAYQLGNNRQEAQRIAGLSATQQAIEIGKIEATLAKQGGPKIPSKKTTQAPDPVEPVGGGGPPAKDPAEMSFDEFEKHMNQQTKQGFW